MMMMMVTTLEVLKAKNEGSYDAAKKSWFIDMLD